MNIIIFYLGCLQLGIAYAPLPQRKVVVSTSNVDEYSTISKCWTLAGSGSIDYVRMTAVSISESFEFATYLAVLALCDVIETPIYLFTKDLSDSRLMDLYNHIIIRLKPIMLNQLSVAWKHLHSTSMAQEIFSSLSSACTSWFWIKPQRNNWFETHHPRRMQLIDILNGDPRVSSNDLILLS